MRSPYDAYKAQASTYQKQAVLNAKPTELITMLYDMLLAATYRKDERKVIDVLSLLIKSLNFDYEIAGQFYSLYEYCQHLARQQKFDEIRDLLQGIRDTWDEYVVKAKIAPQK